MLTRRLSLSFGPRQCEQLSLKIWVFLSEEVLGSGSALWFSPEGNRLAFARFDDTEVDNFTYFKYGEPGTLDSQYPEVIMLKYPKVMNVTHCRHLSEYRDLIRSASAIHKSRHGEPFFDFVFWLLNIGKRLFRTFVWGNPESGTRKTGAPKVRKVVHRLKNKFRLFKFGNPESGVCKTGTASMHNYQFSVEFEPEIQGLQTSLKAYCYFHCKFKCFVVYKMRGW